MVRDSRRVRFFVFAESGSRPSLSGIQYFSLDRTLFSCLLRIKSFVFDMGIKFLGCFKIIILTEV